MAGIEECRERAIVRENRTQGRTNFRVGQPCDEARKRRSGRMWRAKLTALFAEAPAEHSPDDRVAANAVPPLLAGSPHSAC